MAGEVMASQVLETAERMERDAARFYRRAAGMCDDPRLCKLFAELAQWEKGHAQTFAGMRERLVAGDGEFGIGDLELAVASARPAETPLPPVFGACNHPSRELPCNPTKADVLRLAIRKEQDTIAYYTGLREFVLGPDDIEVIKQIIEEEKRHVRILTQSLEMLNRRPNHPYEADG
jgi:rubrerythrin